MSRDRIVELDREARAHKQAIARHRRKLRECRQEQDALRARLEKSGIGYHQSAGEGETHGRRKAGPIYSN